MNPPLQQRQKYLGTTPEIDGDSIEGDVSLALLMEGALDMIEPAEMEGEVEIVFDLEGDLEAPGPELPCPEFPVVTLESRGIRHTDVEEGGPLLAEKAERLDQFHVELRYDLLSAAERTAIEAAWGGGLGLFRRFQFQVPGESDPRWFVFKDDRLVMRHTSAAEVSAAIVLLDVTRGGE